MIKFVMRRLGGICDTHGRDEKYIHLIHGVDGAERTKLFLKKQGVRVWTGFDWIGKGTCGGLLRTL
jgi:hypothetical protein